MGSPNREFAIEAVRQLRQRGWLKDGTTMGAYLVGANLEDADLFIAHLEFADLSKAHLAGAFLEGADLAGAYLEGADLHVATYSDETVWPAGFNPEKAGAELLIKTEP